MNNSKYLFIFAVVTFIFAGVFAFLKVNQTVFFDAPPPRAKVIEPKSVGIDNELWLGDIEKKSTKGNFLADEFHLNWDLVSPEFTKERIFIISYKDIDKYMYSCVKQLLDEFKVEGKVQENKELFSVHVEIKDQKIARNLMAKLDKYDISGNYKEIYQYKDSLKDEPK